MRDVTQAAYGKVGNSSIVLGRFSYGYENIAIRQWGEGAGLSIGSFCSIAANVQIFLGGNHRTDWISTFPFGHIFNDHLGNGVAGHPATKGNVSIGNDVWVGSGVTIMSGIRIGDGAVISANSHVVKDVGDYEIVGGNPARHIKYRFDEDVISALKNLAWWNLPLDDIRRIVPALCSAPSVKNIENIRASILK